MKLEVHSSKSHIIYVKTTKKHRVSEKTDIVDTMPFNDLLEAIARLSVDEQGMIAEIVRNRVIEERREEIANNAKVARQLYSEGKLRRGTLAELKKDLLTDK